ncbi:hypothetical protein FACS18942_05430 [Planctomycetales bacterium]|nr:hypothetical protein FACS18942_05430 [Planctomycetales bacterium]
MKHTFTIFIFFVLINTLFAQQKTAPQTDIKADIQSLIQKLGDDSYVVRQRAEAQLLRLGLPAFTELKAALNNDDSEIVRRAEQILRHFELAEQNNDNESVRLIIDAYAVETNPVQRAKLIQLLASPDIGFGNPNGEGLQTLCRIVRFETERPLRAEAAKALIASAPHTESAREKWYKTLTEQKIAAEQDELCSLVFQFANVRTAVNILKKNAEKKYKEEAKKNNIPLNYPVKLTPDSQLLQQVRNVAALVDKFQKTSENNTLVPGSWLDILVYYAMTELYDDLGLNEERDAAQRAALAVRPKPVKQEGPIAPIDPLDGRPFNEHFFVARFLTERNRFRWTLNHCKLVIQDGSVSHRRDALSLAANAEQMLGDNTAAAEFLQQKIDLLKSEDYKKELSDSDEQVKSNEARRFYHLAQAAADSGDWKKAAELIEEVREG